MNIHDCCHYVYTYIYIYTQVYGLVFLPANNCTGDRLDDGLYITSGHQRGHGYEAAFDEEYETYWESSCVGCVSSQAWLGVSLPHGTAPVRCVQIRQGLEPTYGPREINVQVWGR